MVLFPIRSMPLLGIDWPTIRNQCSSQPLWIMVLQNIQSLPPLAYRSSLARLCVCKVDEQCQRLLPRHHQVDYALEHEHQMLDLLVTPRCVLFRRVHVVTWPSSYVPPLDKLLAGAVFDFDVIGCNFLHSIFTSPYNGSLQPRFGLC